MAERTLVVRIIGDDKSLNQAFSRSERRAKGFEGQLVGINRGLSSTFAAVGISLGSAAVFAGIEKSISAASNLNEQISKSRQIFGESSREIEAWSETTARSMGIARDVALGAAGTFGNLFGSFGFGTSVAAEMSQVLVQLAADMASFNNASPEDMLVRLRSGLVGEAEPLRQFGVRLSEARVQQLAMAETGKKTAKALTDLEKATARYHIILTDTLPQQGNFELTSEGLANQTRILSANMRDLSTDVGGLLIPALTDLTRTANLAAGVLKRLGDIEVPGGAQVSSLLGWVSGWRELDFLLDQIEGKTDKIATDLSTGPQRAAGGRAAARAASEERDRRQQDRDAERSRDRFAASIRGLGLKLDKAGLTQGLDDDLAVLKEIERRIQRQIQEEGRTFKLIDQLTQVRRQIMDTSARIAEEQAQRTRDATEKIIGARQEEADRLRELAEKQRELAEKQREIARQQRERRQGRQFETLGLTAEGQERAPGAGALRRRLSNLREQVRGTFLDTSKTESELDRIAKVLSGKFGKVGRDVRAAILGMLNDISNALKGGGDSKGPLTKFRVANFSDIADQFPSLSQDEARRLQQILSRIGAGGTTPRSSRTGGAFGLEARAGGGLGGTTFIIQNQTVVADDPDAFRREMEKRARRGAGSRTGPRVRTQGGV